GVEQGAGVADPIGQFHVLEHLEQRCRERLRRKQVARGEHDQQGDVEPPREAADRERIIDAKTRVRITVGIVMMAEFIKSFAKPPWFQAWMKLSRLNAPPKLK